MAASVILNKYNTVLRANAAALIERANSLLQSEIKNGSKLLDIGSGEGAVIAEIFIEKSGIKFSKILGSDFDAEHVKFANEKYKTSEISFEIFDVTKEVPNSIKEQAPFDVVTSFHLFHFLNNEEIKYLVKNIKASLLKNGGHFLFFFILNLCPFDLEEKLSKKYPQGQASSVINYFTSSLKDDRIVEDICNILSDEGFDLLLSDVSKLDHTFKAGEMRGFYRIFMCVVN